MNFTLLILFMPFQTLTSRENKAMKWMEID